MSTATQKQARTTEIDADTNLLDEVLERTNSMRNIQSIVSTCSLQAIANKDDIEKAVRAAAGVKQLRSMLTDEIMDEVFMPLMNSQVGFKTDKDPAKYDPRWSKNWDGSPYSRDIVRECVVAALMHGVRATANEFNIISESMYITKQGFWRLVQEFPGVSNVVLRPGVPAVKYDDKQNPLAALVPYTASWQLDGVEHEMVCAAPTDQAPQDTRIPVKCNRGMGTDAILGKAERKVLARVYARLTGAGAVPEGDVADVLEMEDRPAPAANKKVSKSPAADRLDQGKSPTMPTVPDHLTTAVAELLKCDTEDKAKEAIDLLAGEPDDFAALDSVRKWMQDTGKLPKGKATQGTLMDNQPHYE